MQLVHKNTQKLVHKSQNNLYERSSKFYYRRRVFKQLSDAIDQRELKISLRTMDLENAKRFTNIINAKYNLLETHVKGVALEKEQLVQIYNAWIKDVLEELDNDLLEMHPQFDNSLTNSLKSRFSKNKSEIQNALAKNIYYTTRQDTDYFRGIKVDTIFRNRISNVTINLRELEEIVLKYGNDKLNPTYHKIAIREFLKATQYVYSVFLERLDGNYLNDYDIQFFTNYKSEQTRNVSQSTRATSDAVVEFVEQNKKYALDIYAHLKYFEQYFPAIEQINRSALDDFKHKILAKYPNVNKSKTYQSMTAYDLDEAEIPNEDLLGLDTKNKKVIMRINSFLKWLYEDRGYASELFRIKPFRVDEFESAREKRLPYDTDDLRRLFCEHKWFCDDLQKNLSTNYHKVLIPIVALFTGMRLQEVCQLDVKDIIEEDGIMCFNISNDYSGDEMEFEPSENKKSLKNIHSKRKVPIHPLLIKLEIIKFLKLKATSGRLWKTLNPSQGVKDQGRYKNTWGRQFNDISRDFIDSKYVGKKTFYSFRHTFSNALKQVGCPTAILEEVTGHSTKGIATSLYAERYEMKIIMPEVSKIDYGIDFRPIHKEIHKAIQNIRGKKPGS